ncbi:ABC transporter ATP-binding protein [Nitratifractor sp.]|uniref:ABC transporter ATP-binding protein n=1 Tax=Nitratifractor sp. TaxID=2268144 RepID=UPI0025E1F4A7|nr:ABC transporter ATP-binding protein [Nitratifractor sp.]
MKASTVLVDVENVRKRFQGATVLDNVNLQISLGDRVAMMGPNGAGKTTLVRCILGFYHIDGGRIRVAGHDPIKERVEVLKSVGFIPQLPPPVKLTVGELLRFVERSSGTSAAAIRRKAEEMELDVVKHSQKPFFKLSGGMKQKLLIAIALARRSRLLVFDEPTASLDPRAREHFYEMLQSIDYEHAAIYITHRAEELAGLVNREIYMDLGKVVDDERI